MIRDLVL